MNKYFLLIVGLGISLTFFSNSYAGTNPKKLTHDEIVELATSVNNELIEKDIPALDDKIVIVDMQGNIVLEKSWDELETETASKEEQKLINRSSFLMKYAGDSYYIIER